MSQIFPIFLTICRSHFFTTFLKNFNFFNSCFVQTFELFWIWLLKIPDSQLHGLAHYPIFQKS
jgi:hypothetical protein